MIGRWRRRPTDDEFDQEIASHIDHETDRLIDDGASPRAARAEARRRFGNVVAHQERFFESHRWGLVDELGRDLRDGWRSLRRAPGVDPLVALRTE